ncbi:hypothetical protein FQ087_18215 [Sporosarcina sp. ANT_H38]|uniref:hypothetical protein n=1 Tax=Sporosarcina sp. ANT_H38 TaxID=2597358 RepID=UPI0011F1EBC0|nr:hypothetical protein [Sporosarcina sp. ANT_H38]KAA0944061.1 hypothetical protein FQ087_18215 [Sporosarcina sp. ANT_H38]
MQWATKTGRIFNKDRWTDFIRPGLSFKDDLATMTGMSRYNAAATVAKKVLYADEFDTLPYNVSSTTVNSVANGVINVTSINTDPMIIMEKIGSFDPNVARFIEFRYRILNGISTAWEIYFTNDLHTSAHVAHQMRGASLIADGQWHTALLDAWTHSAWKTNGDIRGFRFDWATTAGVNMEIDSVKLTNYSDIVIPVSTSTGFYVGQEVTITDGVSNENVKITAVGVGSLTITPTALPYKINALVARTTSEVKAGELGFSSLSRLTVYEGRNLLVNTNYHHKPEEWNWCVATIINGNPKSVKVDRVNVNYGVVTDYLTFLEEGQIYTLSFEMKTADMYSLNYNYVMDKNEGNYSINSISIKTDNQWNFYQMVFRAKARTNAAVMIGANNNGTSFELRKLKLELGTAATPWTPAPEDLL